MKKCKKQCTSVLQAARDYLRRGFHVVPIPRGLNHPTIKGWQKLRLTQKKLPKYFAGAAGVGLLLKPSRLTDIDSDCPEALAAAKVLLPETAMVHGRRGNPASHHFYHATPRLENESFADPREGLEGARRRTIIEIRTNGQTVVPPSRHSGTGQPLRWHAQGEAATVNPEDLRGAVAWTAAAALLGRYWPKGSRHFAALALAGMLAKAGWTDTVIEKFMLAVTAAARDDETGSRLRDVVSTTKRVAEQQPATGAPTLAQLIDDDIVAKVREWLGLGGSLGDADHHNSDLGNARRLVARHGNDFRFLFAWKKFLVWDGSRWAPDGTGEVVRLATDTIRSVYLEASQSSDRAARAELAKHALKSEAEPRIRAMVELAKSELGVPVTTEQLDADPWLLNCLNGTIDLRTGKLLPHHRENLCTKQAPVAFDHHAKCPTWLAFLNRIMAGNRLLTRFLQRAVGYSLTGVTREQVLLFLYGTGANGKTTFVETIRKLLGDYARQADFDSFLEKRHEGARNDLARLKGARFVSAVEAGEGRKLAETVIKQATGSDTIAARFLYREFFEYSPQFKLFLVANHKPRIAGTDEAIWRRIRLVPFTVTIPQEERDKHLPEKLQRELAGILAWAVRGCLEWQRDGLGEPVQVSEATAEYRREMDLLADFLEDSCVVGERETVSAAQLYDAFKVWCEKNGEEPTTQKKLGTELHERGFQPTKKRGQRCWLGLRLRRESDDD